MTDVRAKYVPPALDKSAFNCPHCGTLTTQYWKALHAKGLEDGKTPSFIDSAAAEKFLNERHDQPVSGEFRQWIATMARGLPFIDGDIHSEYVHALYNLSLAQCYECKQASVWLANNLIWPAHGVAPPANLDLPAHIRRDYDEASAILDLSPRGAAALLRLCIQKLCVHLGQEGKNLNGDIASLVNGGLDVRVQQALDFVRVIGNNAVHPGQIDLVDNREVAEKLFRLVNLITEKMIAEPKHVNELYSSLPDSVKEQIERRDSSSKKS